MAENESNGTFPLQISPKVIQHISSGMYRSPASAIKELLINSFDADATEVELGLIFGKSELGEPKLEKIYVNDNGAGMDGHKLRRVFSQVGDSLKSREGNSPNDDMYTEKLKRPLVGRLGIGILAIASATSSFKVVSKKEKSNEEFTAEVTISQFEKAIEKISAIEEFPMGKVKLTNRLVDYSEQGYTRVEVSEFKPPFMTYINHDVKESFVFNYVCKPDPNDKYNWEGYYEKYLDKFYEYDRISNMTELDQSIIQLGNIIPVRYLKEGPVRKSFKFEGKVFEILNAGGKVITFIKNRLENYDFNVKITVEFKAEEFRNSFYLFKPQLFPTWSILKEWKDSGKPIEQLMPNIFEFSHKYNIGSNEYERMIEINGYAYHQNARINPREYRGLLYRVYNVAIGEDYKDDLRIYSNNPIALHQTSIEVYLDRGFQSVVNIDRESFYQAGEAYQYLKAYLEHTLSGGAKFLDDVKKETVKVIPLASRLENVNLNKNSSPQIYKKIVESFSKPNYKPILKQIKEDMSKGSEARRKQNAEKEKTPLIQDYIRKKNLAKNTYIRKDKLTEEATLDIEGNIAVYSVPDVKTRNKDLYLEVAEFALLHSLKDGKSKLTKEEVELLIKIIDEFA